MSSDEQVWFVAITFVAITVGYLLVVLMRGREGGDFGWYTWALRGM